MLTSEFKYYLPKELIAQTPTEKRDHSRLMIINRQTHTINHHQFFDITKYLQAGDLLVWNNSKVFKARLRGVLLLDEEVMNLKGKDLTDRIFNAAPVEIFLVRPMENPGIWKVLAKPAKKLRLGVKVVFAEDFFAEVISKEEDGTVLVQFNDTDDTVVRAKANRYGRVPTPPYIKEMSKMSDKELSERYQTVYAKEEGSVAAPTAGFHFTPELIEQLKNQGIEFAEITLHVGLGTFLPVKSEKIEDHKMHAEWVEITDKNAKLINDAKAAGRRVVAVGTTTVRTLEGVYQKFGKLAAYNGDIDIFITPGFKFNVVDALITNFHLPESTLIMLVSAFVGDREFLLECYQKAVAAKYRFYSFGDAMLIV